MESTMRRTSLATTLVASSLLAATAIAAQGASAPEATTAARAQATMPVTMAASPAEDAVAVAVIGALQAQFEGRDVEFRIDALDAEQVSQRDLALEGRGDIRIQGSGAWLPVRFEALYDTATLSVLSPSVSLDRGVAANHGGIDAASLEARVADRLGDEFSSQAVSFALAGVDVIGGDARYAVATGHGVADFAGEGEAPVQLQGVYDRQADAWVQVEYSLDGSTEFDQGFAAL
jgi:hypothetical protein